MHHRHVEVFFHAIWSTWDRVPWISDRFDAELRRCVQHHIAMAGGALLAFGASDDHAHVLLRAPATAVPSNVMGAMKGGASRAMHVTFGVNPALRFSQGYALFSVSPEAVSRIARYVEDQRQRHAAGRVVPPWELSPERDEHLPREHP